MEVGRFAFFNEKDGVKSRHELLDCKDTIFEDTRIEGWIRTEIESGTTLCVNPEHAKSDFFQDTQQGKHRSYIELEQCSSYADELNLQCMNAKEIQDWMHREKIHIFYYANHYDIDFKAHESYLHQSLYALGEDRLESSIKWIYMKAH